MAHKPKIDQNFAPSKALETAFHIWTSPKAGTWWGQQM